jgi:hypothetical protein
MTSGARIALQASEVRTHFRGALAAKIPVFFERFVDEVSSFAGTSGLIRTEGKQGPCPSPAPVTCRPLCPRPSQAREMLLDVEGRGGRLCPVTSLGETLARPKSRILACPRSVTKMFAGLMSR